MAHRLLVLGCKTMREGVTVSATFFAAAMLLFLAARYVIPPWAFLPQIVLLLALILILLAPVVLVSTFLLSVIPGARAKLDQCEH